MNGHAPTLTALTVGTQMDTDCLSRHVCSYEEWISGQKTRTGGPVNPDESWTITSTAGSYDFNQTFSNAYGPAAAPTHPFVWASNDTSARKLGKERSIVLDVPKTVHIAGLLTDVTVSAPGSYLARSPVAPHIVTIMEYDVSSGGKISLTSPKQSKDFQAGSQLVFRMRHNGLIKDADGAHVQAAFNFLLSRLSNSPAQLSPVPDTDYSCGDSDGFSDEQMGLQHPGQKKLKRVKPGPESSYEGHICQLVYNYSNCCGGTIISGGGGPH
jgi:hypothetical protein